jgi:cyclopropane-fatty-acyl-phospholipid synthase
MTDDEPVHETSERPKPQVVDFGANHAKTLHARRERFNKCLAEVRALGFDARFIRKWNYYLQYCEAAFASRNISVVQAVHTRPNNRALHRTW